MFDTNHFKYNNLLASYFLWLDAYNKISNLVFLMVDVDSVY